MEHGSDMEYEFYYWPSIQGRGEFVRLALEMAGVSYVDVARTSPDGAKAVSELLGIQQRRPFAPPILKIEGDCLAQTANILLFIGKRHGLTSADEMGQLWVHQLQLTISDLVAEVHDTHHPIAASLYYEEQKDAAKLRAARFLQERLPKFLQYFEAILADNPSTSGHLVGESFTYVDLSLFQIVEGLRYAFPRAMRDPINSVPNVDALHNRVMNHEVISCYLNSGRRIEFNENGIFRHYAELDQGA